MEILRLDQISPDLIVLWQAGYVKITATMAYTWLVMALLLFFSLLATRRLSSGTNMSRWQNLLELIVSAIRDQISEITRDRPDHYLAFVGTLSYSLYLVHYVVILTLDEHLRLEGMPRAVGGVLRGSLALAISLLLSYAIYRGVEKPCATLRKKYASR